jgi:threonine/homoserine/homoserine lactone efflux protein
MDPISAVIAFSIPAALLTIMPGLDTALVVRTAAVEGSRRAMLAGGGVVCGCLVWGLIAALGLGVVLAVSQIGYRVLQIAGAAYLIWLGGGCCAAPSGPARASPQPPLPAAARPHRGARADGSGAA